ncbi:NADPH oxidase 5-like [Xenia sp. Carnegie-2017]|uniref:NADPH oxidase 5-like n=1 Tax=Xenia sp. Carnegie-2017 TaxID=2897299 RepID=UPI001F048EA7|nr:NADPH oxidase 5-like [Xenia sp. Carnegie-2017]
MNGMEKTDRHSLLPEENQNEEVLIKRRDRPLSIQIPAPGESRASQSSPIKRVEKKTINRRSTWFEKAFDAVGNNGVIDKLLFIKATHDIEDFVRNLFELFDTEKRGYISIQEFIGGLRLLMAKSGKTHGEKTLQWFTSYFMKNNYHDSCEIQFEDFKKAFENKAFTEKLFGLLDRNSDGVIDINEFIGSLDRLECATSDTKWFEWIEEHFNVSSLEGRKITLEQFKETLQLEQVFFAERFFMLFDKNGDGKIDMKELIEGLELLKNGNVADKLTFLFRVYDLDGNGYLNREEMKTILLSGMKESKLRLDDQQVDELMEVIFEEVSSKYEGLIGLEEFKNFLLKYPGVAENLSVSVGHLLQPPPKKAKKPVSKLFPKHLRWSYIHQNPSKVITVLFYILFNAALFIWVALERHNEGVWSIIARTHGMCLNFNSVLILMLMLKSSLTWLRSTWIGKYLPIDQHILYHKAVATIILVLSILHCAGHVGRYATMKPTYPNDTHFEMWEYMLTLRTPEGWVGGSAGITGVLLLVILGIICILSQPFVREKGYFELFYFSHHLYIIWWTLLIIHAPNFWKWFIAPAVVYLAERLWSVRIVSRARYGKTFIQEGITYPSKVTHLVIKRPANFDYKPGDYVLVNIPKIAKYEWHPFTISSSPEQSSNIWLHIRAVGTWTKKLYDHYEKEEEEECRRTSLKRAVIRRRKNIKVRESERDNELSASEQRAKSIRRKRLGIIDEDGDENELREVIFEAKTSSLRRSVKKRINKKQNIELVKFSGLKRNTITKDSKLLIYLNGPYGTPSTDFSEAEHAVLISCGIGVTPFASILKTIMLRYQHASHSCPKCSFSWVGKVPFSLRKLQKVDFFWINRDQYSFEWFLSLLKELEVQQSEHEGVFSEHFLDMHIYMTSALRKQDMKALGLQLALELLHEKRDLITGLRTRTNAGRPDWDEVFSELKEMENGHITVFYCGNAALGKILKNLCHKYHFGFKKENF